MNIEKEGLTIKGEGEEKKKRKRDGMKIARNYINTKGDKGEHGFYCSWKE